MLEQMRARHASPTWYRCVAALMILALVLSFPLAGPRPARAAPAAQAQGVCKLVPSGYNAEYAVDQADYCGVFYEPENLGIQYLEISRAYSPADAHDLNTRCHPADCAAGKTCNSYSCSPLDMGDVAPAGYDKGYRGVFYSPSVQGGYAYIWARGCFLLQGSTLGTTQADNQYLYQLMAGADQLVGSDPCAGCDPTVCSGTGTGGSSSVCGPGVAAPEGAFALSGTGCRYDEASDGVTCQATPVNTCPNAKLKYTWSIDGSVAAGYEAELFSPTGLGLCAGTHTVTVWVEDTQNNLQAIGVSWPFTSTQGAPCGAGGSGLTLSTPSCYYSSVEDRLTCVVQVTDAPADADLLFEWRYDGMLLGETTESLDKPIAPDGKSHTIQVLARDPATGKTSAPGAYSFQAAEGTGSIQVQTASGTTAIGGSSAPSQTSLTLNPEGAAAQIYAACPELGWVLLTEAGFDDNLALVPLSSGSGLATRIVLALLILDCGRLLQQPQGALQVAAVGDPADYLAAQAAGDDLPVQLWIGHEGGPLHLSAASDQLLVEVQTAVATVRSAGRNDFGVNLDSETGETRVVAYAGSVEVYSSTTGNPIATLGAGQQVAVAADGTTSGGTQEVDSGASAVGPYGEGSGQPGGAPAPARSLKTALAAIVGAVLLLSVVAVVLIRRRGRSAGARSPQPRGRAAAPAAGPRLVVVQGAARPSSLVLTGGVILLGSDRACALVVRDPLASPQHASLVWYQGAWVLSDASTNGTYVNGVRIARQALHAGDVIQIGSVRLAFQV